MGPAKESAIEVRGIPAGPPVVFEVKFSPGTYNMHKDGSVSYVDVENNYDKIMSWTWRIGAGQVLQVIGGHGHTRPLPKEFQDAYEAMIAKMVLA